MEDARLTLTAAVCLGRAADVERLAVGVAATEKQKVLAAAAYNGRVEAIEAALKLAADPNAPNAGLNPNATALHNAVCSGSLAAVEALVKAGANPEAKDGAYAATPLSWAEYFVRQGGGESVEYFQREGRRQKQYGEIVRYLRGRTAP